MSAPAVRRLAPLFCLFFGLLSLAGCDNAATGPQPVSRPPSPAELTLGPGDTLKVQIYGEPDLSGDYTVASDGSINFPLVGRLPVAGKTALDVEKMLQAKLADGYLVNPQVSIVPGELRSQQVSVIGQVKNPGTFPYKENMSIVEAITLAGGFTNMAKKNSVRVTRRSSHDQKEGRVVVAVEEISKGRAPTFYVHPGDVVFVPERIF